MKKFLAIAVFTGTVLAVAVRSITALRGWHTGPYGRRCMRNW